jgi:SAM-dependent methyltransferase
VLEVASGTGRFAVELAERGADVVALDVSRAMLAEGRRRARRAGVSDSVSFLRADAARLPFHDDEFDAVVAVRFFHLADTPARFLAEMARVSAERVFFDTFDGRSTRVLYNSLLPMGSRLYDREQVRRLLDGAGLSLAGVEHDFVVPFGFYRTVPDGVARAVRRVDEALCRTAVGRRVASVSYWDARVPAAAGSPTATGEVATGAAPDDRL